MNAIDVIKYLLYEKKFMIIVNIAAQLFMIIILILDIMTLLAIITVMVIM